MHSQNWRLMMFDKVKLTYTIEYKLSGTRFANILMLNQIIFSQST